MKVFVVLLVWALQPSTNATKNILEVAGVLDPPMGTLVFRNLCIYFIFYFFYFLFI